MSDGNKDQSLMTLEEAMLGGIEELVRQYVSMCARGAVTTSELKIEAEVMQAVNKGLVKQVDVATRSAAWLGQNKAMSARWLGIAKPTLVQRCKDVGYVWGSEPDEPQLLETGITGTG